MAEQDRQISEVIAEERSRLRNFIRKRVPNEADVEVPKPAPEPTPTNLNEVEVLYE